LTPSKAAEYAENPDTLTAKQRFFDRALTLDAERPGVNYRVQAAASRFEDSPTVLKIVFPKTVRSQKHVKETGTKHMTPACC